jgi:hypothetical protein
VKITKDKLKELIAEVAASVAAPVARRAAAKAAQKLNLTDEEDDFQRARELERVTDAGAARTASPDSRKPVRRPMAQKSQDPALRALVRAKERKKRAAYDKKVKRTASDLDLKQQVQDKLRQLETDFEERERIDFDPNNLPADWNRYSIGEKAYKLGLLEESFVDMPSEDEEGGHMLPDGPYRSWDEAWDQRARRGESESERREKRKARQAERGGAAYQALGDAAIRGSAHALRRLEFMASTDPAAQAILDAVMSAQKNALRMSQPPPLSADLEADMMLEEEDSFQDMSRTADEMFAADAKVVNRAVVRRPDGEEVELKRTAGMSNEEWENAKRVAMGGSPKKKLSRRQRHNKEQDRQYAIHKARKARDQERASMYAGADEPQFEQIVREELEAVLAEKAQSESWEF